MPIADINDHAMYYEIHGSGDPVLCMTGWGTFCHGGEGHLARGLTDRYSVVIFDHRGLGESSDNLATPASMKLYAQDAAGLLDHLGFKNVHVVGLVGMGACISQELAIARPDLVRSMTNMGAWCYMDEFLRDQLEMLRTVHRTLGWAAFQQLVVLMSFPADYYEINKNRLLGPAGPWRELYGRYEAHSRLVDACLNHYSIDRLHQIQVPALIIHAGRDQVTAPRMTLPIEQHIPHARGVLMEDVAHVVCGREQRKRFCDILLGFLDEVDRGAVHRSE